MFTKTITLLSLAFLVAGSSVSRYSPKTVEFVLQMGAHLMNDGLVMIFDEDIWAANEEFVDEFIERYRQPLTLLQIRSGQFRNFGSFQNSLLITEIVCNDVILFIQDLNDILTIYNNVYLNYHVKSVTVVTKSHDTLQIDKLLYAIQSESLSVLLDRGRYLSEIRSWVVSNRIRVDSLKKYEHPTSIERKTLMGRHLTIATLDFPPIVFAEKNTKSGIVTASGIEPSLMNIIAERLEFNFSYILPANDEMWGTLIFDGNNVTVTGLLGLLNKNKADVAYGDLHMQQRLLPYVDFTLAFRNNYECFLVPAPKPYAKWTALYHPFSSAIWAVTGLIFVFAVATLRFLAEWIPRRINKDAFFSDTAVCFLYILGGMVGVQQAQEIRSNANRMFLIWWLLAAATIIPTLYRSGLISFITFPYTPAPIDTIQQLADSSLHKISWGEYFKTSLLNSTDALHRRLGGQFAVATNLTHMFSLLETDSWAVMSNQGNLRYEVSTRFPPTSNGPRVHLVNECVFPTRSAIGLQKHSSLKSYFDKEIYRIVETGIVEHITSLFAKKQDKWDPQTNADKLVSYSLDNLQGAFYLLGFGLGLSTLTFLVELILGYHTHSKNQKSTCMS